MYMVSVQVSIIITAQVGLEKNVQVSFAVAKLRNTLKAG